MTLWREILNKFAMLYAPTFGLYPKTKYKGHDGNTHDGSSDRQRLIVRLLFRTRVPKQKVVLQHAIAALHARHVRSSVREESIGHVATATSEVMTVGSFDGVR